MNSKLLALWGAAGVLSCAPLAHAADWPTAGHDLRNSRYQHQERGINPGTVKQLKLRWVANTDGDVTANPALDDEFLYFPDSHGSLYKLRRDDGSLVWKRRISEYTGIPGDSARATPAIAGNALILGNRSGTFVEAFGQPDPQPARVFAVDKVSGDPLWTTVVDATEMSFITHSVLIAGNKAIVGIASNEELIAGFVPKGFWKWQFRGSVVALDLATGKIEWKTYTVPEGYAGGAIWGSTGAADLKRDTVYMATGNNYAVPDAVVACLAEGGSTAKCMDPSNHFDSIIALNLSTGAVRWAARSLPWDTWNVSCGLVTPGFVVAATTGNCQQPAGNDWDFAQGPMLFSSTGNQADPDLVGAGQKSGMFWAYRAVDGKPAWSRQVAPGGVTGGLQWGSATDGKRIFVGVSNSGPSTAGGGLGPGLWALKDGTTTTSGGWAALDAGSGRVLWTTPDPNGSRAEAALSGAGGVVFGCNLDFRRGTMLALHAQTGRVLWSFDSGAPCNAGPSIADGMVFWGSGIYVTDFGPKKLFAFGL